MMMKEGKKKKGIYEGFMYKISNGLERKMEEKDKEKRIVLRKGVIKIEKKIGVGKLRSKGEERKKLVRKVRSK